MAALSVSARLPRATPGVVMVFRRARRSRAEAFTVG